MEIRLGPVSICDKPAYHKISWHFKAMRLVVWIIALLWNLPGTSASLLLRYLSIFRVIVQFGIQILWLWDFARSYNKTSYQILKQGPVCLSYIDPLDDDVMQDYNISSALAMEILQFFIPAAITTALDSNNIQPDWSRLQLISLYYWWHWTNLAILKSNTIM